MLALKSSNMASMDQISAMIGRLLDFIKHDSSPGNRFFSFFLLFIPELHLAYPFVSNFGPFDHANKQTGDYDHTHQEGVKNLFHNGSFK